MRRRRFPPRPLRRPIWGIPRRMPSVPPKLKEAHRLYEGGEYQKSAALFAELAKRAETSRIQQAPNLYLRSAAAWLKAGQLEDAEAMIFKGLGLFIEHRRWDQLVKRTLITEDKLKEAGQAELARKICAWVQAHVPKDIDLAEFTQNKDAKGNAGQIQLPSNCHNCGGPVNPKEIEWYDAVNPICSFCGSVLNNEKRRNR